MNKEPVTKFDLEAAFKALDELEIPVPEKGIRPNKVNLQETFVRKNKTETLIEDYYDINDSSDLKQAEEDREEEIAKAKLDRIEKIVDLDANSPEDLLPTYVGKEIVQCPQCMTLFYKNPEDVEASEEDPETVNVGEVCQHCGNNSGYTLVGKVGEVESEKVEDELNLNFEEPVEETEEDIPAEEEAPTEETEVAAEEGENLSPVGDEEVEVEESINTPVKPDNYTENKSDKLTLNEENQDTAKPEMDLTEDATADFITTFDDPEFDTPVSDAEVRSILKSLPEATQIPEKLEETQSVGLPLTESKGDKYIFYGTTSKGDILDQEDYEDVSGKVEDLKKARDLLLDKDENITTVYVSLVKNGKEEPVDLYTAVKKGHEFDTAPDDTEVAEVEESVHKPENTAETAILENEPENKTLNEDVVEVKVDVQPGVSLNINDNLKVELENKPEEIPAGELTPNEIGPKPVAEPTPEVTSDVGCKNSDCEIAPAIIDMPIVTEEPIEISTIDSSAIDQVIGEMVKDLEADEHAEETAKAEDEIKTELEDKADAKVEDDVEFEVKPEDLDKSDTVITIDDLDEIDEELLNKHITESLTNVYENVQDFTVTSCILEAAKFIVEGDIHFKSGKIQPTKYIYNENIKTNDKILFSGINEDLAADGKFCLTCKISDKKLITEQVSYKYSVDSIIVEDYTGK